ncbi:MAG: carbon monoxide dehydrogenase subunit G [Nitriliruptoraceae bacterium]
MKISGSHRIAAPRQQVWDALHDPAVLVRTLPGCQSLEQTAQDSYTAVLSAGVASIKGTYQGSVELRDKNEPESYTMVAAGAGTPGTVNATVAVRLDEDGDATAVHFDADAQVGGMIGGVGQRMIAGVAKRTAAEFFRAIERDVLEPPAGVPAGDETPASEASHQLREAAPDADTTDSASDAVTPDRAQVQLGKVFSASASRAPNQRSDQMTAVVAGGALALAGVLIGRLLGRGRRR